MTNDLLSNDDLRREDEKARRDALDVGRSFLVQAPAGSGKTGLLIQRYLALLARVNEPERILAMTFTRKAAGEMRARILDALRRAQANAPVSSDYEQQTRQLALAALAQDRKKEWRLIEQPARMNVLTMDAFCMRLLKQTPILNRWGEFPQIDPLPQIRLAALMREALQEARGEEQEAWRRVLDVVENQTESLSESLEQLLAKSEQWLPIFYQQQPEDFRRLLENSLALEVTQTLQEARDALLPIGVGLLPLMRFAAEQLQILNDEKPDPQRETLIKALQIGAEHGGFPLAEPEHLPYWQAMSRWLLTKEGKARSRLTKNEGFPSGKHSAQSKEAMAEILDTFDAPSIAHLRLAAILPHAQYRDDEWQYIKSLLFVLLRLYARFQVICARDGVTTFTEVQLAALNALTNTDDGELPSDLLLQTDMQVEHLLIDEFQDTSLTQESLIDALTSGWQAGDQRTLFVVGDPIQSIYHFRQAEVGIFLRAQKEKRIGSVPVSLLSLTRNFRSRAQLVDWCNHVFPNVFPHEEDILRGAVTFKPAAAERSAGEQNATLQLFVDEYEEAQAVVNRIRQCQGQGLHDIALLVRGRSHLRAILPELRAAGIRFASVKLDKLSASYVVDDLCMLMRTLLQPNDELAWASVLRAPWCGLLLKDFVALSRTRISLAENGETRERSWFDVLHDANTASLDESAHKRLLTFMRAWQIAYDDTRTESIAIRVHDLWLRLRGPSFLEQDIDLAFAEMFFDTLHTYERHGDIGDWAAFRQYLDGVFLDKPHVADESDDVVKIMTLHEAKGLEFDVVMIPALARKTGKDKTPLLRWRRREDGLLLAPRDRKDSNDTSMNHYLKALADEEGSNELMRLMYVGATRAREQLWLTATLNVEEKANDGETSWQWKAAPARTMLSLWWNALNKVQTIPPPEVDVAESIQEGATTKPFLMRITDEALAEIPDPIVREEETSSAQVSLSFQSENFILKQVGTFVHRRLANIGIPNGESLSDWAALDNADKAPLFAQVLMELGIPHSYIVQASERAVTAMRRIANDPFAQWLLSPEREDARNEWGLQTAPNIDGLDGKLLRVDRTFIDQDTRWVIDYKVADMSDSDDIETWLAAQVQRYYESMKRYALLFRAMDTKPVKTILYFPLLQRYQEVMIVDD